MLRKIIVLCSLFTVVGCTTNDVIQEEQNQLLEPTQDEYTDQLGYVHYTQDELENEVEDDRYVSFDRNELANIITKTILQNEGFNEVATLVTRTEVLIAFDHNEKLDEDMALDIAEKVAGSVMPRFYEIYASSNRTLIPDIHSLHNSRISNNNYQNTIDNIIREMKKK